MLGLIAGCRRSSPTTTTYPIRGIVRAVNPDAGDVTIAHEAIPGFMGAMTMPFTVADRSLLDDVRPGDEVAGVLRVRFEPDGKSVAALSLAELGVTRPALTAAATTIADPVPDLLQPGATVPDFAVTTQAGDRLLLSDWRNEVIVLTFIFTRCPLPEFCPAIDAKFADLARRLAIDPARAARVRLLSVSFDPDHDTPAILTAHAHRVGAKPPLWTFAVASRDELAKVAGPIGLTVVPGTREIAHNLRTVLIDRGNRLVQIETGSKWSTADLARAIRSRLDSSQPATSGIPDHQRK